LTQLKFKGLKSWNCNIRGSKNSINSKFLGVLGGLFHLLILDMTQTREMVIFEVKGVVFGKFNFIMVKGDIFVIQ